MERGIFATCSNDKFIKIWNSQNNDNLASINIGVPVNSLCYGVLDQKPFLLAGTFHGGVALIDKENKKVLQIAEKKHCTYVSSVCFLSSLGNKFACSISADKIAVWRVDCDSLEEWTTVPLDFTQQGDYKWWEVVEVKSQVQSANEAVVACCSSKDNQTRAY